MIGPRAYLVEAERGYEWTRLTVLTQAFTADEARDQVAEKLGDEWTVRAVRTAT